MILDRSISELARLLRDKKISSVELVSEAYSKAHKLKRLNSFITLIDQNTLIKEAQKKDASRTSQSSELHGIPFSLKDAYVTKDIETTSASKVLDGFMPPYDASVYSSLSRVGAILIGKNNLDAWGHGGSTENTDFGAGKNPWNETCIPGGSSGGSAIAISTGMVSFAIGEDTGGSIRCPASMCNVSGLKVTYGRVSRFGTISYASSLDSVGPMAKSVEDLALVLEHIAGKDIKDATSSNETVERYRDYLGRDIQGKVIGLPAEFFTSGLDPEIEHAIRKAATIFESLGAHIKEVSIPMMKHGVALYYLIALSETSSNLARYDGIRYGTERSNFSAETERRIMLGTYALSAGYADKMYKKAQKARSVLIQNFNDVFETCDVLLAPVNPSLPSKIGELINDPVKNLLEDLYTGPVNLVGVPSLSVPVGFSKLNLPIGMQLIGKKFHEGELFSFGHAYQRVTDWHTRQPPIELGGAS